MKLHKETVSPNLLGILEKLMVSETLKDFCLVGGTALSLQRGHRRSIDIDLFTDVAYLEINTREIRSFLYKFGNRWPLLPNLYFMATQYNFVQHL